MNLRYSEFVDYLDLDSIYDALEWSPESSKGDEDIGYCLDPWGLHKNGDTTGKLAINRTKKVYNCWVCEGGSMLDLVMAVKDMNTTEATEWLYQFTRPRNLSPDEFYDEIDTLLSYGPTEPKPAPYFNHRVLDKWTENDHEWFSERGISQEVREYFKLGYDPFHERRTRKAPAIVIPHFWKGKLVGWQERWLDGQKPKYTNTEDFPRHETVWGYDFAIEQQEQPFVVESVPSALFLLSHGYPAVATFGGEVTVEQMKLLRVFQQGIIVAPDNDAIGRGWVSNPGNVVRVLQRFVPVLVAPYVAGDGADLGDLTADELPLHLRGISYPLPL
jgi:DNA primase